MNYLILKSILEATITHFRCKGCGSGIGEADINLLGVAGNAINFEVICPSCRMPGVIKAEVGMAIQQKGPSGLNDVPQDLLARLKQVQDGQPNGEVPPAIADADILSLRENLKECQSFDDLLK